MSENTTTTTQTGAREYSPTLQADRVGFERKARAEQKNFPKEYLFRGYSNFAVFCRVNMERIFPLPSSGAQDVVKNQVELFLVAQKNTIGGCGCNKNKRRDVALKVYKETVEILTKSEDIKLRMFKLLNNPSKVLFLEGVNSGAPSREEQEAFIEVENDAL